MPHTLRSIQGDRIKLRINVIRNNIWLGQIKDEPDSCCRNLVAGFHQSKVCSVSSRQMECEQPLASRRHRATSRYTFSVPTDCRTAPMSHQADVLFTANFRKPNPKEGYFAAPRKRVSKPQPLSHLRPKIRSISKKKYRPGVVGIEFFQYREIRFFSPLKSRLPEKFHGIFHYG